LKCPAKIIKQYRCTVYALDILGRVSKHSKDNIKKAGDRSIRLFGRLPDKLKLILGSPLDTNLWTQYQETNTVPEYLNHFELDLENGIKTRGILPIDSHVLENNEKLPEGNGLDDDDDIENIEEDDDLNKLRLLHRNELLDKPDLKLRDINRLFTNLQRAEPDPVRIRPAPAPAPIRKTRVREPGIDIGNIVTEKRVRFRR
jgi:hypothetical protein